MIEVRVSVDVERPPDEVFAFLADASNNPSWQKGMQNCEWTSEPPLDVGSTYNQRAKFLGKQIVSSFEVTEFEAGERIRMQSTGGSMPIDVTRSVESGPNGNATVSAIVRGDSSGVFRLASPIMRALVGASVRRDYRRLKQVLEA